MFSQSCLCSAGYYFVSANNKWGSNNATGNGPNKDYLLPCQPCSSGTYKSGNNLLGLSACTPCSSTFYANSKSSTDEYLTGKSFQASSSIVQVQAFFKKTCCACA